MDTYEITAIKLPKIMKKNNDLRGLKRGFRF
jgi:hypothetical protein